MGVKLGNNIVHGHQPKLGTEEMSSGLHGLAHEHVETLN